MTYVENRERLLDHGNRAAREMALEIVERALAQADPYRAVRRLVKLEGDILTVGSHTFNLSQAGRIFVVGAGKAAFPIARALEDILGERIQRGIVICKYGQEGELTRIEKRLASHPVPDESGFAAAQDILALVQETQPGDIVFAAFTGGSSALMPYPVAGVTLEEKKQVNRLLLYSGANIIEINAVRKHLSQIKGGRLARAIHPGAHIINLTVSDVIGDPLDYITCPTVPDTSTFAQARATLTKYGLWDKVPASVREYLKNAGPGEESPKDLSDHNLYNFVAVPGTAACRGAYAAARELGLSALILSTMLEGESREVGGTFADIAREIRASGQPLTPPCAVIGGGETTVRISGHCGEGGPNQEFALGAALRLGEVKSAALASVDTDGTDGPTQLAGALVDETTLARAQAAGINLDAALAEHDVSAALRDLGEVVLTGATGTNVNDLKVLVVLP
ncbi:MAG TPA: glycerate kinase [Firmicutes bacterium]|nr:glycerate kinase [Bacillota bacterium]